MSPSNPQSEVLVFDVNETLLDIAELASSFRSAFGSDALLPTWFGRMLRDSLVATVTDQYRRFDELGTAALQAVAGEAGQELDAGTAAAVVEGMRNLPAHPDVPVALERLASAGYRMATLTNSAPDVIRDQLRNSRLESYFEHQISVDDVRVFKPHPATYEHAARRLGVGIGRLRLIAAHDWDVVGAVRAGARAGYVARYAPLNADPVDMPDLVGHDLGAVADQLLATA